ncbi:hypothetical protein B0T17DRAFT_267335 [Bombardia bombarda]|uniref:Uncharacterized protein n=1 Tax=Bombardia bombarda TaxID=252184 RepID=A0AA39X0Z6_9PEZI|nr:hypothetical protein B0T17DRAFT_267335 [Bombardia bombarda]
MMSHMQGRRLKTFANKVIIFFFSFSLLGQTLSYQHHDSHLFQGRRLALEQCYISTTQITNDYPFPIRLHHIELLFSHYRSGILSTIPSSRLPPPRVPSARTKMIQLVVYPIPHTPHSDECGGRRSTRGNGDGQAKKTAR